jgi:Universal stress protein family
MRPTDEDSVERATDGPASILVGVDGSVTAARAGWYAAGLARRQHARVTMVCVAPLLSPWRPWDAGLEAAEDMRREAAAFAADLGVGITFLAVWGDPFT